MNYFITIIICFNIVSCGTESYNPANNRLIIKKENIKYDSILNKIKLESKTKEIIIWNNISEKTIQKLDKSMHYSGGFKASLINIECKNINQDYNIIGSLKNHYSLNGSLIDCSNYDFNNTKYSGSETYILSSRSPSIPIDVPPFHSAFQMYLEEHKTQENIKPILSNYNLQEIKNNISKSVVVSIARNANEKWVSFHLDSKTKRSTIIYKIPKNVNITCEEFGYPLEKKVNETKIYIINLEDDKFQYCDDTLFSSSSEVYGSETYLFVEIIIDKN